MACPYQPVHDISSAPGTYWTSLRFSRKKPREIGHPRCIIDQFNWVFTDSITQNHGEQINPFVSHAPATFV